jgi:CRISPR/Cas system-associated exonuclease Cas4 (RecB family)
VATPRAKIRAPWSASKVQTALLCPRLFHYRYVEKVPEPEVMPEARLGKAVHAAIEAALANQPLETALAEGRKTLIGERERVRFELLAMSVPAFLERIAEFRRKHRIHRAMIEFSLAVREDGSSTQFYSADAFYRGVLDAAYLYDGDNLALVDHKTGFRARNLNIEEQLEGYAVLAAAHFRSVRRVWLGVHWLADADVDWARPMTIIEVQRKLVPRVMDNIEAAALAVEGTNRTEPGVWCYRCNYRSICPAGHDVRYEPVEDEQDPSDPEL